MGASSVGCKFCASLATLTLSTLNRFTNILEPSISKIEKGGLVSTENAASLP